MGVYRADGQGVCNYTTNIATYTCPMDCNGRGTCEAVPGNRTRVCTCEQAGPHGA